MTHPAPQDRWRSAIALLAVIALAAACTSAPSRTETQAAAAPAKATCEAAPHELVVKDLQPGNGEAVRFRTAVLVNYTGWLWDGCAKDHKGAQFDTSIGRPVPFSFMVGAGRVIRGWDQGLIGMKEGGKRLLIIPPQMGYGLQGAGRIPPNSTLVFEIDLLKIIQQPPK